MPELAQDVLVTIIAMACGVFIFQRVFALVRPQKSSGCSNCAASKEPCAPQREGTASVQPRPVAFVSSKRR